MSEVLTFLPYLGLDNEISLGNGIKLWNFHRHKNRYIPDASKRALAEIIVNMFEYSEWVNIISIRNNPFVSRTGRTVQEIQLMLLIASLSAGNVMSSIRRNDDTSSSLEHFSFNEIPLDYALKSHVNIKGSMLRNLTNPELIAVRPKSLKKSPIITKRTPENTALDMQLVSALNKLKKMNKPLRDRIFRSLEMLSHTATNNTQIPNLSHIIMSVATFENLFGSGRVNVKNKLDQVFHGHKLYRSKYEKHGVIYDETSHPMRTSHAIWYEHLCRSRNRILHGEDLEPKHYYYHNQRHRYIAQLIYVRCLKYILNKELSISLPGDIIRINEAGKRWFQYSN